MSDCAFSIVTFLKAAMKPYELSTALKYKSHRTFAPMKLFLIASCCIGLTAFISSKIAAGLSVVIESLAFGGILAVKLLPVSTNFNSVEFVGAVPFNWEETNL